jgi:hypothetical protein
MEEKTKKELLLSKLVDALLVDYKVMQFRIWKNKIQFRLKSFFYKVKYNYFLMGRLS